MAITYARPYQIKELIETYDGDITLQHALEALNADIINGNADNNVEQREYRCPKCAGIGEHALSKDTGNPADTQLIPCTLVAANDTSIKCDGWGYLTVPVALQPGNYITVS